MCDIFLNLCRKLRKLPLILIGFQLSLICGLILFFQRNRGNGQGARGSRENFDCDAKEE